MRALLWVTELFSSSGGKGRCCPPCPGAAGDVVWGCCSTAPRPRLPRCWGGSVCACARHRANSMVVAKANNRLILVSPYRAMTSRWTDRETRANRSLTRLFFELWRDVRNFNHNQLLGG